ncbi:MAG: HPr family phosphocarrier protein [Lachnospiraceae bacterium]|nr:HPr family phosphocarrier protein [Lachnospiraceae bacterium]
MMEKNVTVGIKEGINADVVSLLVQTACKYDSTVYLKEGERRVNMKSIMGMMNMAAECGTEVTVIAEGSDEKEAVADIESVLKGN